MEERREVSYRVLLQGGQGEYVEKKSRFIATLRSCRTEGEAAAFVEEMKNTFGASVVDLVFQGKKTLSGPMKALGADLEKKRVVYDNNPVLKWCLCNTSVDVDKNDNIQPAKGNQGATRRIDGMASLLDAYVELEKNLEEYISLAA